MRRMIPSGRVFVSFLSRRLIYWVVFGFLNIVESIVTFFVSITSRNGLYYVMKVILLVCCFIPEVDVGLATRFHL